MIIRGMVRNDDGSLRKMTPEELASANNKDTVFPREEALSQKVFHVEQKPAEKSKPLVFHVEQKTVNKGGTITFHLKRDKGE